MPPRGSTCPWPQAGQAGGISVRFSSRAAGRQEQAGPPGQRYNVQPPRLVLFCTGLLCEVSPGQGACQDLLRIGLRTEWKWEALTHISQGREPHIHQAEKPLEPGSLCGFAGVALSPPSEPLCLHRGTGCKRQALYHLPAPYGEARDLPCAHASVHTCTCGYTCTHTKSGKYTLRALDLSPPLRNLLDSPGQRAQVKLGSNCPEENLKQLPKVGCTSQLSPPVHSHPRSLELEGISQETS
jgi:hypothetical protein